MAFSSCIFFVLMAICGAIAMSSDIIAFNSTHPIHNEAFGMKYPTNSSTEPWTYGASVSFNVSQATFVETRSSFIIGNKEMYNATDRYTSESAGVLTASYGTVVPPCYTTVDTSYFFITQFNATTDGAGDAIWSFGELAIPTWKNESTMDVKCQVPNIKCHDYYSLTISAAPVSQLWTLTVESTKNITVHFYIKQNNTKCESTPYFITGEKFEDIGLPAVDVPIDFWLGIEVTDPSLTSQVKMWWKLLATDAPSGENTPSEHNSPVNGPSSGTLIGELPRWAIALMIIFAAGIVVLIIVLIALCIKRRKRANYSTM